MQFGRGQSFGWPCFLALLLGLLSGCAANRVHLQQAVLVNPPRTHLLEIASAYHVRCPDVLRVDITGLPHYSGPQRINVDGRINLGEGDRPCVDGETPPTIVRTVARAVGVPPDRVHVEVIEYNSQYLYLFGQIAGMQRAVPYQGPETAIDLLRRVGGLTPGAAPRDIRVIRPHIADGKVPEVFHVDLAAILVRNDPDTNLILEPYDQVHIGQSRRSTISDCLPPWLRPLYDRACGIKQQGIGNRE